MEQFHFVEGQVADDDNCDEVSALSVCLCRTIASIFCLFARLSMRLFLYLPLSSYVCFILFRLFISLFLRLHVFLSIFIRVSDFLSVCLPAYLSVCFFVSHSLSLSSYLYIVHSICLSAYVYSICVSPPKALYKSSLSLITN